MSELIKKIEYKVPKKPCIRITADLEESLHKRLSIMCAKTSKTKVEVIRMLLSHALDEFEAKNYEVID